MEHKLEAHRNQYSSIVKELEEAEEMLKRVEVKLRVDKRYYGKREYVRGTALEMVKQGRAIVKGIGVLLEML